MVSIAQLTHHSVRGGGENPSTFGLGIARYRTPMSFRYKTTFAVWVWVSILPKLLHGCAVTYSCLILNDGLFYNA